MQPLVSSLSAGDCLVYRLRKNSSFLTGTQDRYMQPLISSLSAGDCPVHRLRKNCSSFLTGAQDSHLQKVTMPEAAYIQLRRRPPKDEQGTARNM